MPETQITWAYLGKHKADWPQAVRIGNQLTGGPLLLDVIRTTSLWLGALSGRIDAMVDSILALKPDAFWLVPMHESILVGLKLTQRNAARMHLSVQDDQCDAIAARSRRYRHLIPLMRRPWLRLMQNAASIDVCSEGMQQRYASHYSIVSDVFRPWIESLPQPTSKPCSPGILRAGHIGSIYSTREWLAFVNALRQTAQTLSLRPHLRIIGPSGLPVKETMSVLGAANVEVIDYPDDQTSIRLLNECHFLYAMYPFDERSRVFRQTSLPSKLSNYLRAQRPILAHTPSDSTLAAWMRKTDLGLICSEPSTAGISASIAALSTAPEIQAERYEHARKTLYGEHHAKALKEWLLALGS